MEDNAPSPLLIAIVDLRVHMHTQKKTMQCLRFYRVKLSFRVFSQHFIFKPTHAIACLAPGKINSNRLDNGGNVWL